MTFAVVIAFIIFIGLLLGGMWVSFALGISGLILLLSLGGWNGLNPVGLVMWGGTNSFILTAIPLFIFMGDILVRSRLSDTLYTGLSHWVQKLPGGLLHANIIGSAIFGGPSGSSLTTAMIMGRVAAPEMRRRNYDQARSTGSLAAGGTLGILIPPSIAMVLFGTLTDTSVAKLFMAGIIPGLLLTLLFMIFAAVISIVRPQKGKIVGAEPVPMREKLKYLLKMGPVVFLIVFVLAATYVGFATPTEAAALGVVGSILAAKISGKLTMKDLLESLKSSVRASGMIMMIVLCGQIFSFAVELAGIGQAIAKWAGSLGLNMFLFMLFLTVLYLVLGMFMDSIGLIIATVPVFFPVAMSFGIDPIWFGIYMVLLIEVGQITPPMGLLCFAIQGITGTPLGTIYRGVAPYVIVIMVMLAIIAAFPQIVTFLPSLM